MRCLIVFCLAASACGATISSLRADRTCRVWSEGLDGEHAGASVSVSDGEVYREQLIGPIKTAYYQGDDMFADSLVGPYRVGRFDGHDSVSTPSILGDVALARIESGEVHRDTILGDRVIYRYNAACSVKDAALGTIALYMGAEQHTN